MGMLTIRNIDDELKARLRLQAAQAGMSMEEAVRNILRQATTPPTPSPTAPMLAARQRLLAHLATVQSAGPRNWTRDELYD